MKRFLIFEGEVHEPQGGMSDLTKQFDTFEDVKNYIKNDFRFEIPEKYQPDRWFQIHDLHSDITIGYNFLPKNVYWDKEVINKIL